MAAESRLVHNIRSKVLDRYPKVYVRKLADRFTRGVPDLLIICPDVWAGCVTLLVEAKAPDGHTARLQEAEHEAIRRAGGNVVVAKDVQSVLDELQSLGAIP